MQSCGYPFSQQAMPFASYPQPYPVQTPVVYGGAGYGGAWYALLIVLFIVIIVFGSIWYVGGAYGYGC